jgi:hypothetical protein
VPGQKKDPTRLTTPIPKRSAPNFHSIPDQEILHAEVVPLNILFAASARNDAYASDRLRLVNQLKVVKAAVFFLRSCHKTPSAARVIELIRLATGEGMRKGDVCRLIKQVLAEDGNRSGTAPELSGTTGEPFSSTSGTIAKLSGTAPEHHAGGKTIDAENIDSRNAAAAVRVREPEGLALELATWFYEQAVTAGAAPPHEIRLVPKRAAKSLGSAEKLLQVYERDVIEAQARRMFVRARAQGRDRWLTVTLEKLLEHWNAFDADRMPWAKRALVRAGARRATRDDDRIAKQLKELDAMVR